MILNKLFRSVLALTIYFNGFAPVLAQSTAGAFYIPTTNSKAVITQTIAATTIEVTYHRPNKRGREIFGQLVPYGQVWRTGSDAATEIYFSTPVQLAGTQIDSGRYELFTIPDKNTWQIMLQKQRGQWGSYSYNPENNAASFSVTATAAPSTIETFTISIDQIGSKNGILNIAWDNVIVPIKIAIDLKATVIPKLEELLTQEGRRPYFHAAMFYFENDIDINRAAELMALALEPNPGHIGMLYRQALILERKGDKNGAIEAAKKSLDGAQSVSPELKAEYTRLNTALLEKLEASKR